MEFKDSKGIFQQIGDNLCEKILSGELLPGSRIPSVRELAASVGVNHNTIMRSYTELQREGIINNQRGIGYFVSDQAPAQIAGLRKKEFLQNEMPEFIRQIQLLSLNRNELQPLIDHLNLLS